VLVILPKFAVPNAPLGEENSGRLKALNDGIAQIREMSGRKCHDSVKAHTSPSVSPEAKSRRAF
jgi:hypothetical protein